MNIQSLQRSKPHISLNCSFDPAGGNDHFFNTCITKVKPLSLSGVYQLFFSLFEISAIFFVIWTRNLREPLDHHPQEAGKTLTQSKSSIKNISKPRNGPELTKTCVQNLLIFHSELAHAERSSCDSVLSLCASDVVLSIKKKERKIKEVYA